ncbi:alkaline phosphatase family protein [Kitasatospora purpeofusca]|uniref:alkaline phosphatase family protein n=1 Tax=Kitasatospora purpeofusca TaxID=67352 RepID=UPI00364F7236
MNDEPRPGVSRRALLGSAAAVAAVAGEISAGKPIGLGFRVPMIVVSPWTCGGYVCSEVFDHTSVLRFCSRVFGVPEPTISPWRRAVTGDLMSVFDFTSARTGWPYLPDTVGYHARAAAQCDNLPAPRLPDVQTLPAQEAGHRRARALPYAFEATGRVTPEAFWIDVTPPPAEAGGFSLTLVGVATGQPGP